MLKVYVAGPITKGDLLLNVRAAVEAADRLLDAGLVPFVPHLNCLWHLVSPKPYGGWLAYDREWLSVCDYVVRLPGESAGADSEVALAGGLGIPVYHGVDALLAALCGPAAEGGGA